MLCSEFTTLIDSYLAGDIPEEQREEFELHYFECDGCFVQLKAAERLQSKEVPIAVALPERSETRRSLFGFLGEWVSWKPVMAMASIVVVAFLSVLMLRDSGQLEQLKAIAAFSPPPYVSSETRGTRFQADTDRTFHEAMEFYQEKDYSRALTLLDSITRDSQARNPQFVFYRGICLFSLDRVKEAVAAFDVIISDMNPSYYDEALYYKAIALVHLGKTRKALELLGVLSEMYSPLSNRAREMTREIKTRL